MQVLDFDFSSTVGENTTLHSDDCATEEETWPEVGLAMPGGWVLDDLKEATRKSEC